MASNNTKKPNKPPLGAIGFYNEEFENGERSLNRARAEASEQKTTPIPEYVISAFPEVPSSKTDKSTEAKIDRESGTLFQFTESIKIENNKAEIDTSFFVQTVDNHKTPDAPKSHSQPIPDHVGKALGMTADAAAEVSKQTIKLTRDVVKDTLSAVFDLLEMFTGKSLFKKKETAKQAPETPKDQAKAKDIEEKKFVQQKQQEVQGEIRGVSAAKAQDLLKEALMMDVGPMSQGDAKALGLNSSLSSEHIMNKYHLLNKATKMDQNADAQKKAAMGAGMGPKGSAFNLDRVSEGGSVLSSTGGAGAG